jgi:hypothetical protein
LPQPWAETLETSPEMAENHPKRPLMDNWSEVSSECAGSMVPRLSDQPPAESDAAASR